MPNIANVLKDEIRRLARKELKTPTVKLHRETVELKRTMADLRKRLVQMEREVRQWSSREARRQAASAAEAQEPAKFRISVKGIRSLRRRLGLSQADFARLLGVSALSVYNWEHKDGQLSLRRETKQKLAEIRGIGRREAKQRLAAL